MNTIFSAFSFFIKILIFIVASFFLIHLLAFLGIFLALGYPLWWFLAPTFLPCLICNTRELGAYCFFCEQPVVDPDLINAKNFKSAILNSILIMTLSLLSLGFVFAESQLLAHFGVSPLSRTVSFVIPSEGQYQVGQVFTMDINLDGIKRPINAVQADFSYDPKILEVIEILTDESFATVFIQKKIDNDIGYSRISGGLPNPGFFADSGLFATVVLRGKTAGISEVNFLPSSMVLANDGRGTNVIKSLASAAYLIVPPKPGFDESEQQSVILSPQVLGSEVEEDVPQLKFFQEETINEEVLGTSSELEELQEADQTTFFKQLGEFLQNIASFILEFWISLFKAIAGLFGFESS